LWVKPGVFTPEFFFEIAKSLDLVIREVERGARCDSIRRGGHVRAGASARLLRKQPAVAVLG
jgi:hypothetical protein